MTPEEYQAAGLYDPSDPHGAERLELLRWLEEIGLGLEDMLRADARRGLTFAASSRALRPGPYLSREQLAERLGAAPEFVEAFRVAFSLPPPPAGQPWCNENEARMFQSVAQGVAVFGEAAMLRFLRVVGSASSRVAEAMIEMNRERMLRLLGPSPTELDLAKASLSAVQSADGPVRIMEGLLSIHLEIAASRMRQRRETLTADTLRGCVGFVDLVGSTTLLRRKTAPELAAMVDRFEEVCQEVAIDRGGRIVKFIGDEVMFVTSSPGQASDIALGLIEAFADDDEVTPRAGLADGELLDRGGDYYGPVVNLAARLAELAVPEEVLVNEEAASRLDPSRFRVDNAGRRMLRGFDEPISLRSVTRA